MKMGIFTLPKVLLFSQVRDFVVWNVISVCMTCILETLNYIFVFVKEVRV